MFSKSNVPRFSEKSGVTPPNRRHSGTLITGRGRTASKNYGNIYQEKNGLSNSGSVADVEGSPQPARPKSMSSENSKTTNNRIPIKKPRALSDNRKCPTTDKDSPDTIAIKSSRSNETSLTTCSNNSMSSRRYTSKSPSGIPVAVRHTNLSSARLNSATNAASANKKRPNSYRAIDFQKRDAENHYNTKMKQFQTMKADLLKKQNLTMELYKQLAMLKKRIKESEGKELPLETLKIVDYGDNKHRLSTGDNNILDIEEVKSIKKQLENTPAMLVEICRKIIDEKQSIIDKVFNDDGEWNQDELIQKIKRYKEENASVKDQIEEKLKVEEEKLTGLLKEWHSVTKLQPEMDEEIRQELDMKLQETEHRLKQALTDLQFEKSKKLKENDKVRELEKETAKYKEKIKELTKNVEEEKAKVISQKEHQSSFDQKLKTAKGKIRDAESQKAEAEYRVEKLNNTIKKMEEQWRSKEIYYENRQKEMHKHIKAHEATIAKFEKERSIVDTRFDNIRDEYENNEKSYKERIDELEESLKHSQDTVEQLQKEKKNSNTQCDYLKAQMNKLGMCHHSIFELCKPRTTNEETDNSTSRVKTDEEVALWTELEETKTALRMAEDKLEIYRKEKERFMESIKINYNENKDIDANPLLLEKDSQITKLILENKKIQHLKDEIQQEMEQKNITIQNLQEQVELYKNQENEGIDDEELITDLRNKFETELLRNAELQQQLSAREHDLYEAKKTIGVRDSYIQVRDTALGTAREKRYLLESENKSLKEYIEQMKDKISWLNEQHNLKNKELYRMSKDLDAKSNYVEVVQAKIDKLEDKYRESTKRRMDLQQSIADLESELRHAQGELHKSTQRSRNCREERHQFLGHVKNLSFSEFIKYNTIENANYNPMDSSKSSICSVSCVHYNTCGKNRKQLMNVSSNESNSYEESDIYNDTTNQHSYEADYL